MTEVEINGYRMKIIMAGISQDKEAELLALKVYVEALEKALKA